jgi:hypothetical protein
MNHAPSPRNFGSLEINMRVREAQSQTLWGFETFALKCPSYRRGEGLDRDICGTGCAEWDS